MRRFPIASRSRLAVFAITLITVVTCFSTLASAAQVWEIDTYGNGAMLEAVFRGLALFAGPGGGLTGALKLAGLIGLLGVLVSLAGTALTGGRASSSFPFIAIVAGTVATLSTSTVPLAVVDKVAATSVIVNGVPLPIAIIGYFTSTLGSRITEQVEQAVMPVDAERFMTHGLGWGPRVAQAILEAQIQDAALRQDLDMYIQVCVSENFNTGHKTAKDLTQGTTAEQILGDTNPAIPFVLPSQYLTPPQNQSCLDAWTNILNPDLTTHASSQQVLGFLAMRLHLPSYADVGPAFDATAPDLLNVSISATEALKLRFAANQLLPSLQAMSAIGNQNGMVTAWGLAEAQAQQTSGWLTTGLLLQQVLPVFHAALEVLFYGFLLLGLPMLMFMPSMIFQIMQTAIFLQLWPVAYVFGNLFLYTQVKEVAFLTGDATQGLGLSLAATPAIQGSIQNAYAASGFPIMIGLMILSGMIFGGGFAIQKVIQSAPGQSGPSSVGLGNIGFGNITTGNRSDNNTSEGNVSRGNISEDNVTRSTRSERTETVGTSAGRLSESRGPDGRVSSAELTSPFGTETFDPHTGASTHISNSSPTLKTNIAAVAEGGNALTVENAKVQQRATEHQNAQANNLNETFTTTGSKEASQQHGITEGTREAFQNVSRHEIGNVLQHGEAADEMRQHFISSGGSATLGASAAPEILGFKIGGGGQMEVSAQFKKGEDFKTTLSSQTSNKVLSQAQESLGRTSEFKAVQQEAEKHGESSSKALGFSEVQRTTQAYNEAVSKRESVATTLKASQGHTTSVGVDRSHMLTNALWDIRHPGVNRLEAIEHNDPAASSFYAELGFAAQNTEKMQELEKEGMEQMRKTGQLDQYLGTSAYIKGQQPAAPSAAGLKPVSNPLPGSGYVEPTGPGVNHVKFEVQGKQAQADSKLEGDQQALHHAQGRLTNAPTAQEVHEGTADTKAKTEGGALKASGQAYLEVGKEAVGVITGIGGQFSAMWESQLKEGQRLGELSGGPPPKEDGNPPTKEQ